MNLTFPARIKSVQIKVPKATEEDPTPLPVTVVQIECDVLPGSDIGKLANMMHLGVDVTVHSSQLGFAPEPDGKGGTSLVPEGVESVTLTAAGKSVTVSPEQFSRAATGLGRR